MSKATMPAKAQPGKKTSKVKRQEPTYTTNRKTWGIQWIASTFHMEGNRSVQDTKAVWIEMERSVEFFPSDLIKEVYENLREYGFPSVEAAKKAGVTIERLLAFLESYAADRKTGVLRYEDRVRPVAQHELEEELVEAYQVQDEQKSIITQQAEQLEELRERLAKLEKNKGG